IIKAKTGDMFSSPSAPKISYSLNDKWFAAGNSEEQVNAFVTGAATTKQDYISKISGHPMGVFVDVQKILKASEAGVSDGNSKSAMAESIKIWDNVIMTGGELDGGSMTSNFEINLMDKNTNSLKQLNQYTNAMTKIYKRNSVPDMPGA